MTTIAEEKASIVVSIKTMAQALLLGRKEVIDAVELAQEMLVANGVLDSGLPALALHYGKQRTVLKGRDPATTLHHGINAVASYTAGTGLTMPTPTAWGYIIFDDAGNEVTGFAPADYYLTKLRSDDILATLAENGGAFATPIVTNTEEIIGVGDVDGARDEWVAAADYRAGNLSHPTTPNGFFYTVLQAGTSGSVEPVWDAVIGAQVADGDVIWRNEGREISEWLPSVQVHAADRVYPATPMGSHFQASLDKRIAATHGASPDYLLLGAVTLNPSIPGLAVTRAGNWQSLFGPATAIASFGYLAEPGTNRLLMVAIGTEDSTTDTPVRFITYGGRFMARAVSVSLDTSPGTGRVEFWFLPESELAQAVDTRVVVGYHTRPDGPAAAAIATFADVNQDTPFVDSIAVTEGPLPPNPIVAALQVLPNTMQVALAWSGSNGGFSWNSPWLVRVNAAVIPNGASFSVADSDDTLGMSGSVEPAWPSTLDDSILDGGVVWVNAGSTVRTSTLSADAIVPGTVAIRIDGVAVGHDDGAGSLLPESGDDRLGLGTVDYITKEVSAVFHIPQKAGELVTARYDGVFALNDWNLLYGQLDFSTTTSLYGSSNQFTLRIMEVLSAALATGPRVYDQMRVRARLDHSVLGTLIVVTEGLQGNPAWDFLSDPPQDATAVSDAEFKLLLGWLDPDNSDDIGKGSDPDLVSTGLEDPANSGLYPYVESNPMFPATDGKNAVLQPGGLADTDVFAGSYAHIEDRGAGNTVRWYVLTGLKFLYELSPTAAERLALPMNPLPENPDELRPALQAIVDFAPNTALFKLRIPADVGGGVGTGRITFAAVGPGGIAGSTYVGWSLVDAWAASHAYTTGKFVKPLTGDAGFVFECTTAGTTTSAEPAWNRVNGATTASGGAVFTCRSDISGEYACYYNQVQHLIDQAIGLSLLVTRMDDLGVLGAPANTVDPGQQTADNLFDSQRTTFETALDNFVVSVHGTTVTNGYNPLLAANRVGGGGSDYPQAGIETTLDAAASVFKAKVTIRLSDLNFEILGPGVTTVLSGLDYCRKVYDAANLAANMNMGYMRRVNDKLNSVLALYGVIVKLQSDYARYP